MYNIIDSITTLLTLSEDELNELLCDEKYNKQNLRELIRRILKELIESKAYIKALKKDLEWERKVKDTYHNIAKEYEKSLLIKESI